MESEPPSGYYSSILILLFFPLISIGSIGNILFLILLIICSALISGSEVAYFSLSPTDQKDLKEEDTKTSKRILNLTANPQRLLATILISNNFINILIIIISGFLFLDILPETTLLQWGENVHNLIPFASSERWSTILGFLITTAGVTFILVLFGEITPKIYANLNNVRLAKFMSSPLSFFNKLFNPLISLLVNMSSKMESKLKGAASSSTSKEDIDSAIDLTVKNEAKNSEEVDMLKGIIKFNEVSARQIMTSRVDIMAVDDEIDFKELLHVAKTSAYSRIPVFKENLDDIIGILYIKDLIGHYDEGPAFNWQDKIRKNVLFVPELKKIDELLQVFQQKRQHMAIIIDEYGGTMGLVTLEDIIEEITGEIKDEFDFEKVNENTYIFEGKILLNDACRIMGIDSKDFDSVKGESDSLGGLILEIAGQIPKRGKVIKQDHYTFKIKSVGKKRIEKVEIQINEKKNTDT